MAIDLTCKACSGSGKSGDGNFFCHSCQGTKQISPGTNIVLAYLEYFDLVLSAMDVKIDAIKEMLDSAVYGMQKMSSNLDDIMVKLDV